MGSETDLTNGLRALLRGIGSLWFAALILILLLVALACATVFESSHGAEQALAIFYKSLWLKLLLVLLGINSLAALIVRFPFKRRQIGFVLTHISILVILLGSLVTERWGIDGQVGVREGQTVSDFGVRQDSLTLANLGNEARSTINFARSGIGGVKAIAEPATAPLKLDQVTVEVERYLPDSDEREKLLEGGASDRGAIEVLLEAQGREMRESAWLLDGQPAAVASVGVLFRSVADRAELDRLMSDTPASQPEDQRVIRVEIQGAKFDIPMASCLERPAAVGNTGYTVRVLNYLPHAVVGEGGQLRSASDRPVNPAVEVELVGPEGPQKHRAFARFPDFASMHGSKPGQEVKVTFIMPTGDVPTVPIEILAGPEGDLHARFAQDSTNVVKKKLELAVPVETPWAGIKLTVLRRMEHARMEREVVPVEPVRKDREPALLVRVRTPQESREMWVRKFRPLPVRVNGATYEVTYGERVAPLGFELTLDRFEIGTYPGTRRPRTFESHVQVFDPVTGRKQRDKVISMNNPLSFGGYTLYQSSYHQDKEGDISYLAVSWDPGQPIVFAGYIAMLIGMVWVLAQRVQEKRMRGAPAAVGGGTAK